MDNIYTLNINGITVSSVDEHLNALSEKTGLTIRKLYITSTTNAGLFAYYNNNLRKNQGVEVQVYALDQDGSIITKDQLNKCVK